MCVRIRHIVSFVKICGHTIIMLSVAHRCDLIKSSCVNKEITVFNRQINALNYTSTVGS
jgi:hypothetical protein